MKKTLIPSVIFSLFLIITPSILLGADQPADPDCPRDQPGPVYSLKSPGVKSHLFKKTSSFEAEEEVIFVSGDRLLIKNWGCEYYVNSFYYESKNIKADSASTAYWHTKSAEILRLLARSRPDTVFDLKKAADTLEIKAKGGKGFRFDHEPYPVEGDGTDFLQTMVTVKKGGNLPGKDMGFVEFELMKGPL